MKLKWILLCVFLKVVIVDCAKILAVFPTVLRSHHNVFRPIIKALVDRGHQLVVITPFPEHDQGHTHKNLTEIDIHEVSIKAWAEAMTTITKDASLYSQAKTYSLIELNVSESQFNAKEVQSLLKNKINTFDLIIAESHVKPLYYLSWKYTAPLILLSSTGPIFPEFVGATTYSLLYPEAMRRKINNLTIWNTLAEIYQEWGLQQLKWSYHYWIDEIIQNLDKTAPSITTLYNNVDFIVVNNNRIWDFNRPVPLSAVYLYDAYVKPLEDIPREIKTYLDSSINGVIYLSFGTSVSEAELPKEKIDIMLKIFSELPYNVLWKWNDDEFSELPKNVLVRKWFPQSEILRHPKVKLFITQGGRLSLHESIAAGVPLIGVPIVFDQFCNVQKAVHFGIGRQLDIFTLTDYEFRNAVLTVIEDKSYRYNVERLRSIFQDQPQRPQERAVWWMEHVLRHGGARHLRAPAANMPWTRYYELELLLILITFVIAISTTLIIVVKRLVLCIFTIVSKDKIKRY